MLQFVCVLRLCVYVGLRGASCTDGHRSDQFHADPVELFYAKPGRIIVETSLNVSTFAFVDAVTGHIERTAAIDEMIFDTSGAAVWRNEETVGIFSCRDSTSINRQQRRIFATDDLEEDFCLYSFRYGVLVGGNSHDMVQVTRFDIQEDPAMTADQSPDPDVNSKVNKAEGHKYRECVSEVGFSRECVS